MVETQRFSLAGVTLDLVTPASVHLREDSAWRSRRHYDPFLATCTLPAQGVALDIGAGFGTFALPFARRYPGWTLWCFEPGAEAFAALSENITRLGLINVRAFNVAVGGPGAVTPALSAALTAGSADLRALCPEQPYRRHRSLDGFHDARRQDSSLFEAIGFPTLPAAALVALQPDLVKLIAPFAEREILEALGHACPATLVGESWETLPPALLPDSVTQAWMPFALAQGLGLRRRKDARQAQLDVVIEASAADPALQGSLDALPPEPGVALHVVLPPGGNAPASMRADVTLLQADRPGTGAAFNLGRRRSTGSHLAFLRAGDRPASGSLGLLRQLAELSGAEMVQGGGPEGPGWTDLPRGTSFYLQGRGGAFLSGNRMLADFAPVRARIWRRDFLDARRLWCPEHLADFAEHHLHFQALPQLEDVPVLPDARILPHPAGLLQDEALYLPEVFRLAIKQVLVEGWRNPAPLIRGFAVSSRAIVQRLAPALRGSFLQALAETQVMAEKSLGADIPDALEATIPGLAERLAPVRAAIGSLPAGYGWGWQDAPALHPAMQLQKRLWQDRT